MALMYKCDRCGKIYEPYHYTKKYPKYQIQSTTSPDGPCYFDKELCPECSDLLEHWFTNPYPKPCNCTGCTTTKKRWWQK